MMPRIIHIALSCLLATLALWFTTPTGAQAASDSAGTEFFVAFQPNTAAGTSNLSLFITGQQDTQGVVEIPGLNFSQAFTVQANRVTTVNLPSSAQSLGSNSIARLGVRVTAQNEVTVYGLNQRQYTTDAFLSLPADILGLEYLAMSYPSTYSSYPSQVAVVGVYDNTQVTITPSVAAVGRPAGVPFTITLNRHNTFQLAGSGTADITGSIITTSAPVAVMSGVDCVNVPVGVGWCDHIVEMMPPVATWGKSFLTVPLATRLKGDVFRILASQDGTTVHINGVLVATLNRGKFFEKVLTARSQIEAGAPVLVAQYSPGQGFDNVISDPFMMLIPPTEQFLNHYTFSTPASGFTKNFVNVVAPASAISSLSLDGSPINTALFSSIGSSGFSGAQVPVSLGSHTIAGDVAFGIYVYGFGSYDSYGYPGGMAFQFINPMGDTYLPNVRLSQIGDTIQGTATDSEDNNANGILDAGEDLNGNGSIDRRSEDVNGNGKLDSGEDLNGNGFLDRDTGIFKIELEPGSANLQINTLSFIPGALSVNFSITLIDPKKPGTGVLKISDGVGNSVQAPISLSGIPTLKDVRVIDTISTNNIEIDAASFSKTPYSLTTTEDKVLIEWRYDTFPVNLTEDLGFDVILKNPISGEQRIVIHKLELLYIDANGNPVRTELGPQYVHVLNSAFNSILSTDKPVYQANENVLFSATITNLSGYARTIDAKILIEDSHGILVKEVTTLSNLNFTAGETKNFSNLTFNAGSTLAGDFRAHLILYEGQKQVGETLANFKIKPTIALTSKVTTDKIAYKANEQVSIISTIQSASPNFIFSNLNARITITNSGGQGIFTDEKTIPILTPGQLTELKAYWNTAGNPKGIYKVTLEVFEGIMLLGSSHVTFEIISSSQTGEGLTGIITASPNPVYQGRDETITYTITNKGNEDIANLKVKILIVNPDTQEIKNTFENTVDLSMNTTATGNFVSSTSNLTPRVYLAILQARTSTMPEFKTLSSTIFEVKPGIEVTKTIPDKKNILVWLNYPWQSGQNCPDRTLIEQALKEAGVSYYIVLDKKDFETELRNPYYTDFLILGDHNPIEDHFSEELREQVYSGKGLLSSRFNRQNLDADVFGIKFNGYLSGSNYPVELLESEIASQGSFQSYGRAIKIEAEVKVEGIIGWTIETTNKGTTKYPGIIKRQYGNGKVLFYAFDLGLSSGNYSQFADLLKNSLNYIHKPLDTTVFHPNQLVPVEIKIKSLGGAFDMKITETYPEDIKLYDPVTDQWVTDNPWIITLHLEPDDTKTILYYTFTPDKAGTYILHTEAGYMENETYHFYQELETDIVVDKDTIMLTDDIINALQTLPVTGQERAKVDNAVIYMRNVQNRSIITEIDIEQNIHDILKAIESLLFVSSVDTSDVRLRLNTLLEVWEGRWHCN